MRVEGHTLRTRSNVTVFERLFGRGGGTTYKAGYHYAQNAEMMPYEFLWSAPRAFVIRVHILSVCTFALKVVAPKICKIAKTPDTGMH